MQYDTPSCTTQPPNQETLRQIIGEITKTLEEARYEARGLSEVLEGTFEKASEGREPSPFSLRDCLNSIRYQAREVARLNTVNHSTVGRNQLISSDSTAMQTGKMERPRY